MYKAKLLENIVAHDAQNQANGILKNATLAVPLKYLSNFWRSLEMPLIAKLNQNLNGQSIAFCLQTAMMLMILITPMILFLLSKTQNYMFLLQLYQQETIEHYQNFLAEDFKDQFIGMNIRQKVRIKIRKINKNILLNQILLESIDCFSLFKSRYRF